MEATYMPISRWMDKEIVVLSYKKENIWVSSNEVEETGVYYTQWSKSEREIQILYINLYIFLYISGIQKDGNNNATCMAAKQTDVKNRFLDSEREDEGGMIWESSNETCILPDVK